MDRRDPLRAGTLARIDHDQQFQQVIVDGWACGLHQKHVPASDVFVQFAVVFAVGKLAQRDLGRLQVQVTAYLSGQLLVGSAAKDLQFTHNPSLASFRRPALARHDY